MVEADMGPGQKRTHLQAISQAKIDDAIILLKNKRYSNAYYLSGYAVEIGLKACISRQIIAGTIPDKEFLKKIFSHNFKELVGLAGLLGSLNDAEKRDKVFAEYWAISCQWVPDSRYEDTDRMSSQQLVQAIADENSGVLKWIKAHW